MKSRQSAKIRCYLDFDGTLTNATGKDTVFTPLYTSLQIQNDVDDYADLPFKSNFQEILAQGLKLAENKSMNISEEAKDFLNTMLKEQAEIIIVSLNRQEYIAALLQLSGIDGWKKIVIMDCSNLQIDKDKAVKTSEEDLKQQGRTADFVFIADDDASNYIRMRDGLTSQGYVRQHTLIGTSCSPGKFPWPKLTKSILDHRAAIDYRKRNAESDINPASKRQRTEEALVKVNFFPPKKDSSDLVQVQIEVLGLKPR